MKITRKQLKQIILEAFKDLSSILPGPKTPEERSGRRRISRRDPRTGRPIKTHPIRGMVSDLDRLEIPEGGTPATINSMSDVRFDDRKAKNLTSDSPFVAGSSGYHATYQHTYTEDDLTFLIKKTDPDTGAYRWMPIKGDYPDHAEGTYVMIPALFSKGLLGVCQIISSMNLSASTVDGKDAKIPVLVLKSIDSGRVVSKIGKAFVKKVAGPRSLHKAEEVNRAFVPKIRAYRE